MSITFACNPLPKALLKITAQWNGEPITRQKMLQHWRDDFAVRSLFADTLLEAGGEACFWETPPWTNSVLDKEFECVVSPAPALLRRPANPKPFAEHFDSSPETVHCFPNLGGDAQLIAPAPVAPHDAYPHLVRFLASAPLEQVDRFWQMTAEEMLLRISNIPLWLSTAGLGVAWLHLRIDTRPKYYRHHGYMA